MLIIQYGMYPDSLTAMNSISDEGIKNNVIIINNLQNHCTLINCRYKLAEMFNLPHSMISKGIEML